MTIHNTARTCQQTYTIVRQMADGIADMCETNGRTKTLCLDPPKRKKLRRNCAQMASKTGTGPAETLCRQTIQNPKMPLKSP